MSAAATSTLHTTPHNRVALVTGAGSGIGIGLACAAALVGQFPRMGRQALPLLVLVPCRW